MQQYLSRNAQMIDLDGQMNDIQQPPSLY
jgi:hypothetical protein